MHYQRSLLFLVMFFSAVMFSGKLVAQKQYNTSIKISVDKSTFHIGEPIWIYYKMENIDPNGPKLMDIDMNLNLVVTDSKGKQHFPLWSATIIRDSVSTMDVGEKRESYFNLLSTYGVIKDNMPHSILPAEEYSLKFCWIEEGYLPLESNEIRLVIKEEEHEKKAFLVYLEMLKNQKDLDKLNQYFKELNDIKPNSIYRKQALYYQMIINSSANDIMHNQIGSDAAKQLLEEYQDEKFSFKICRSILMYHDKIGKMDDAKIYLKGMEKKIKNKKTKNNIQKVLEKIEKKTYKAMF